MNPIDFKKLAEPFSGNRISWRVGMAGKSADGKIWVKALAYFDARDGMDRLDEVIGPDNWSDSYRKEGESVICRLGIRTGYQTASGDPIWVYKEDASDETDIEAVKGGMSGAFKRACVKWGIGRYLYDLKEGFANVCDKSAEGAIYANTEKLGVFYWQPPRLPDWALPEIERNKGPQPGNVTTFPKPVSAPSALADPGEYKFTVGKHFKDGKAMQDLGPHGVNQWLSSMQDLLAAENKPATGKLVNDMAAAEAFLKSRETKRAE